MRRERQPDEPTIAELQKENEALSKQNAKLEAENNRLWNRRRLGGGSRTAFIGTAALMYVGGVVSMGLNPVGEVREKSMQAVNVDAYTGVVVPVNSPHSDLQRNGNHGMYLSPRADAPPSTQPSAKQSAEPRKTTKPDKSNKPAVLSPEQCVAKLPFDLKVAQKLMVGTKAQTFPSTAQAFNQDHIGAVIIMQSPQHPQDGTIKTFADAQTIKPEVAVDQEGGDIQRITAEGHLPAADKVGATMTPDDAEAMYTKDDKYLLGLGITTNLGPVVDVHSRDSRIDPLPHRMYGNTGRKVVRFAQAFISAGRATGMHTVVKHYLGLGTVRGNTDDGPQTTVPLSELAEQRLPYQILGRSGAGLMMSNAKIPGLSPNVPAGLSPEAVASARSDFGDNNTNVYTDSLTAKAILRPLPEAVVAAWEADADMALIVNQQPTSLHGQFQSILAAARQAKASGALSDKLLNTSVLRLFGNKGVDPCSKAVQSLS